MRRFLQVFATMAAAALAGARAASACPSCPTAPLAGDVVCGDHLWANLMTAAPFVVFAAVTWALSRIRGAR